MRSWFGTPPGNWTMGQVKNLGTVTLGKMLQSSDRGVDVLAPYLRAANVQPDGVLQLDDVKSMWFGAREITSLDLRADDVVVVEGGVGGFGRAAFLQQDLPGIGFQNSINRVRPSADADGRFIAYFLIAARYVGFIHAYCDIVSMPHLTAEKLAAMPIAYPRVTEQHAIADYLDAETARIDTLIAKQTEFIERLAERRAAVLTDVVTGRFGGSALVPASSPWIGTIPEHWTELMFSRDVTVAGGLVDPRDEPWRSMPLLAPNHVVSGTGQIEGVETAAEQGAESGKYVAAAGQVVYSKIRPLLNKVTIAPFDCLCSADMYPLIVRSEIVDRRFLMYWMLARPFHTFASLTSDRVKMPKINRDELKSAPWARPPLDEQRRIANQLDFELGRIDTVLERAKQHIELAKERRSALITAAVTGQIDVRTARKAS